MWGGVSISLEPEACLSRRMYPNANIPWPMLGVTAMVYGTHGLESRLAADRFAFPASEFHLAVDRR